MLPPLADALRVAAAAWHGLRGGNSLDRALAEGEFEAIRRDSKNRFDQNFGQIQKKFEEKIDSYTVQSKDLFARLNEEKKRITAGMPSSRAARTSARTRSIDHWNCPGMERMGFWMFFPWRMNSG